MNRAFCRSAVVACVVTVAAGAAAATASAAQPPCRELVRFNPLNFPTTPAVTNSRLPLIPGWQRVYEGRSNVSGQSLPHQVTFTVTDLTKVINGVRTVVVHDVDFTNGQLAEQELSFWAQDNQGNVWNLGEYPEEWFNGQLKGAPSTWMAGLDGAVPGIHMPVRLPEPDEAPYLQGYVPRIKFLDCASTFQTGTTVCVPVNCFRGVVITDETSPLDPESGHQRKTYAAGVGIIDIGFVDDPQGERLVLTQNAQLAPDALAAVRATVLEMDVRGYGVNPTYRRSVPIGAPVQQTPAATAPVAPVAEAPFEERPAPDRRATGRVSLSLRPGGRRVSRSGQAAVRVACATPATRVTIRPGHCRGTLDLAVRGTGIRAGAARFSVPGGMEGNVRVALTRRALALLRRRHHLPLVARTRGAFAGERSVVARLSLTITARR